MSSHLDVKVRFAPSPTGKLHVGNVRTALMNKLVALKHGGTFILRIDDTDRERSTKDFEDGIREDLRWLGLPWDETFKQSERFERYDAVAEELKARGLLYPAYETADELDRQRKLQRVQGRPPVYNRAALELTDSDRAALEAKGRRPHWRFKLSGEAVVWTDLVRGEQSIDTSSLSDPVLIRGDGTYLYTLPSVVDDIDHAITHVIRGEDHVTNSGAQIEIFRALGDHVPAMAHTPLLVGKDGSKLSKRLDGLSIRSLREGGFEPMAIASYLASLGTSDANELAHSLDALAARFDFAKFGRAPARFDTSEMRDLNAKLIHGMSYADAKPRLDALGVGGGEAFWQLVRDNLERVDDAAGWNAALFAPLKGRIAEEDAEFCAEAASCLPAEVDSESWAPWTKDLKNRTGRKGRGLFMPLRLALTGRERGPDMGGVLALLGADRARARLRGEAA